MNTSIHVSLGLIVVTKCSCNTIGLNLDRFLAIKKVILSKNPSFANNVAAVLTESFIRKFCTFLLPPLFGGIVVVINKYWMRFL